jgi:WD40 repeat protein
VAVLEIGEQNLPDWIQFTTGERLLSRSVSGLWQWDIRSGQRDLLYESSSTAESFAASADGRRMLIVESDRAGVYSGKAVFLDLDSDTTTSLEQFGTEIFAVAIDPAGKIAVTGHQNGEIRVGPVSGQHTHLLLGHESTVWTLAIDPLGRWIASGGSDSTIRLWPMPDLSQPPLHTLPREDLIAKLKALTNLRVVRDEESATGWKLTHDPFPGWETVPTW